MCDEDMIKCFWCESELKVDDVIISSNKWAYCKNCKKPILDMLIQPEEHFLKRNEDKIEHDDHISLMMKGYL